MRFLLLEVGPFLARCVIVAADRGREAVMVDPGFDVELAIERLAAEDLVPRAIVLTHAHLDHAYGVSEVRRRFPGARLLVHAADVPLLGNMAAQAAAFGFEPPAEVAVDQLIEDRDTVAVGDENLLVRHTPGHSPGHIVLIAEVENPPVAIVGDVLFAGSIGRTDLWGGSFETLEQSIREILYRLPGTTRVIPGHGPETTIATEIASNPFVPGR